MLNIAFCDDNQYFLKKISREVDAVSHATITYECFSSAFELIGDFQSGKFDALFIDIYMPKMNGKMLARKIRSIDRRVKIVFVTRYEHEILNTLQYDIYGFLPKDQLKERLGNILIRLKKSIDFERTKYVALRLKSVTNCEVIKKIYVDDILYIQTMNHKIILHLINGEVFGLLGYKFQEVLTLFEEKGFLQVHREVMVNPLFINEIQKDSVVLDNSEQVPLSRRKRKIVQERFMCGLRENINE